MKKTLRKLETEEEESGRKKFHSEQLAQTQTTMSGNEGSGSIAAMQNKPKRNKVYVMYVGGTIGMQRTAKGGYHPVSHYLRQQMNSMPEFNDHRMPEYFINEYNPLLDSSDMNTSDWVRIAEDIRDNYNKYHGFVVVHGTDTMAYTASALSFMLENLGKIVVLTGAQIPLCEVRNDGRYNLISAVMIAGTFNIPEVCIFFDRQLLRGNRCKKVDIWGLKPFDSLNYPPLATVGIDINVHGDNILPHPKGEFRVQTELCTDVVAMRIFPGFSGKIFNEMLHGANMKAIVLEAYGSGNFPERQREFLGALETYIKNGVIVVIVSQVTKGSVNLDQYATGQALKEIGVISGNDMTIEAALTKLQYLLGKNLPTEEIHSQMLESLAGEVSPLVPLPPASTPVHYSDAPSVTDMALQFHSTFQYYRPTAPTSPHSLSILAQNRQPT